jgi:arylsulfatase A-like enzyme
MSAPEGRRRLLRQGAIAGAAAWSAYAIVENLLLVVLPRLLPQGQSYRELHAGVSASLFVLYPLLGALAGVIAAAALSRLGGASRSAATLTATRLKAAAMIPLALTSGATLLGSSYLAHRLLLSGLAMSLAGAILLALVAASERRLAAWRPLAGPWTVSVLLLGSPWVCDHVGIQPPTAALAGLVFVAAVAGLALFAGRFRRRHPPIAAFETRHATSALALASLVLGGVGATLHEEPKLSAGPPVRVRSGAPRPNVVLITLDTVRADHLSLYGYARDTSPGMRALAARSTVYLRAIAPADMTLATHASIFSGLYPSRHGAHFDRERCPEFCALDESQETLAELLARQGYRTAGVVANYGFLGPFFRLDQGFQFHDARRNRLALAPVEPYTLRQALRALVAPRLSAEFSERVYRRASEITDQAIRQVERLRSEGAPFFLFLNFMDAHEPYMPPPPYDRLFPGKDPAFRREDRQELEKRVLRRVATATPRQLAHLASQYDGGIAYIDSELTRFLHHLEATGLFEDALVVVTADHGEAFGDHQLFGHDISVYQEGIRVPLLVRFPRQLRGEAVATLTSLTDLFPTILEEAGVPIPPGIDGRSLLGAPADPDREMLSETFGNALAGRWQPRLGSATRAIFEGDLKLIVPTVGSREAYDLAGDPGEARNLYRAEARWRDLEQHLDRWLREAALSGGGGGPALDAETAATLRSLGYL